MYIRYRSLFIGTFILLAVASVGLFWLHDIFNFFSLQTLQWHAQSLIHFVHTHYVLGVLIYLLVGIVGVLLFLPMVTLYMLAGGFLFGPWFGALYAIIGVTIGAYGACILIRATLGPWIERYEKRLVYINGFIRNYGFYAVLLLRASHMVPFFLLNLASAVVPISLSSYCMATLIGVIPGALLFAWTGQYLCTINSIWDIISVQMLGLVVGIACICAGCFALISWLMYKK